MTIVIIIFSILVLSS